MDNFNSYQEKMYWAYAVWEVISPYKKYIKTILNNSMETVTNKTNSTDWVLNNNPHQIPITPFMRITSGVT